MPPAQAHGQPQGYALRRSGAPVFQRSLARQEFFREGFFKNGVLPKAGRRFLFLKRCDSVVSEGHALARCHVWQYHAQIG
jgi:hypothetical protein